MGRARSRRRRGKSGGVGSGGTRGGNSGSGSGSGKGSGSGSGKGKGKSKNNRARQKLNKKIQSKKLSTKVKSVTKAVAKNKADAKNKTISASQSRRQVRQRTRDKIATRKKINMPSLGQVGRTLRNIRQPISGLSSMAINSVLGRPGIASTIAQAAVNNLGAQNQRTRDMSKLSPQQQRKYQQLSEKTGRDYSIRNPTFRLNMNMRDIARFAGLDQNRFYNKLPRSIREAQVNKQFYGNPMKKGWHSSQRTGRGQGIKLPIQLGGQDAATQTALRNAAESWLGGHQQRQAAEAQAQQQNQAVQRQNDYNVAQYESAKSRMGPQQDWLGSLYSSHNINQGKLDQGARDYWSNEAKTKGRDAVMQSIIGTSKAQGTYGGRKKPQRITTTGSGRSIPKRYQTTYKGRTVDSRFAGRTSYPSKEKRARERAKRKAQNQAKK